MAGQIKGMIKLDLRHDKKLHEFVTAFMYKKQLNMLRRLTTRRNKINNSKN